MSELRLDQRTIAVPESRELEVFAAMLERRGATVLRCPLVAIHDAPDPEPVLAWLRRFCDGVCTDLVLLTGEGLRRLTRCLETHQPALRGAFVGQLARVRKITRGPKPGRALRELGLSADLLAAAPTTEGVIATLATLDLRGHTVGVQLYGTEPNRPLIDCLQSAGARTLPVAPYIYADAVDEIAVLTLVEELARGEVDAIAFTSVAQIQRLFAVARRAHREPDLRAGLGRTVVAAVGPVVADALRARAVNVSVMPAEAFFLKPLTTALAQALARR